MNTSRRIILFDDINPENDRDITREVRDLLLAALRDEEVVTGEYFDRLDAAALALATAITGSRS